MKTIDQTTVISEENKALLRAVKKTVRAFLPTAEVLLYGSVAAGTHGPDSDCDILVLTDNPVAKEAKRAIERQMLDLELTHDVVLSTLYHSKAEWRVRATLPFHSEVERSGIVL